MVDKIFLDATGTPIGRIGAFVAKKTLGGDKVFIVNSEKAIITGNKITAINKWKERRAKGGSALRGPYHSKDPEKVLKRAIRGMLPDHRSGRGKEAWSNIRCFNGVPEEYKDEKLEALKTKIKGKYITLEELKRKL
jgi:large subunit ribosomal protein L13